MRVRIEKLDHFGRGITSINNKVCFVKGALDEEVVEVEIIRNKSKYLEAETINIIDGSLNREKVKCPYYNLCGGCHLLHMSYKRENKFKKEKVQELLQRYAGLTNFNINDTCFLDEFSYRNKVVLHGKDKKLGYFSEKTHDLIEIDSCLLLPDKINSLIETLKKVAEKSDINSITIRTSNNLDKVMVKIDGKVNDINDIKDKVDVLIVNNKLISNENKIISKIGNISYYVSIDSFFQVNKTLTEKLYEKVLKYTKEIKPQKVLDLYCGTGTIGIYISKLAKQIIGVDSCQSSIDDALENIKLNNIKNIKFICNKVENVIDSFIDIDMIIVDPPRAGLDKKTIDYIQKVNPKNIVYVSCDPMTLARDIKLLKNYQLEEITPFNMFPRTYHVECVCVLNLK